LRAENKALRQTLRVSEFDALERRRQSTIKDNQHARNLGAAHEATRLAKQDADEIRHRLKNTLAVVQAIARATLRDDIPMQASRAAFNKRLVALGAAHDILFNAGWESANLPLIIRGVLAPYPSDRVRSRGPAILIDPKQALAFALALHELASNASKYGALSAPRGYVDIVWTAKPTPRNRELRLRWHERDGPTVVAPLRDGFGTSLIKNNLAREFGGTVKLDFRPRGVVCTLEAPLPLMDASARMGNRARIVRAR
jgi:two-component sensor histidine kinase